MVAGLKYIFACLALAFCLAGTALADDAPKFYISVDPQSGGLQDDFIMSVTIEGQANGAFPKLSGGEDFKLSLIGPETSIEIINGAMRSRQSYRYRLIPLKEGKLLSPSAEITMNGERYEAPPVEVTVAKGASDADAANRDVFIRQDLAPQALYVGQQAVNSILLYSKLHLYSSKFNDLSFDGFWNETLGNEQGEEFQQRIGQDTYRVLRLRKAIFPLKAGNIPIQKRTLTAAMRLKSKPRPNQFGGFGPFSGGFFDDFFEQGRIQEVEIDSNTLSVPVVPLPAHPSDLPLLGLKDPFVGSTSLALSASPGDMKVGDSKTFELSVTTEGLINPLKTVPLDFGPLIKAYPEAPTTKSFEMGGKLHTKRRFRISLVAAHAGTVNFPGVKLGWFDPAAKEFKIASTEGFTFEIMPSETPGPSPDPKNSAESEILTPSPKPCPSLKPYAEPARLDMYRDIFGVQNILILLAALGSFYGLATLRKRLSKETFGIKSALERAAAASDLSGFRLAVVEFLSQKTIPGATSMTTEEIKSSIRQAVANKDLAYTLQVFFDEAELVNYRKAKRELTAEDLARTKDTVIKALNSLP